MCLLYDKTGKVESISLFVNIPGDIPSCGDRTVKHTVVIDGTKPRIMSDNHKRHYPACVHLNEFSAVARQKAAYYKPVQYYCNVLPM